MDKADAVIKPLQPVDILVALKLAAGRDAKVSVRRLAEALDVPKSTVDLSLHRLRAHGLLRGQRQQLNRLVLRDLVQHGIQWVAPGAVGMFVLGLPTAVSAPLMKGEFIGGGEDLVIPLPEGPARGRAVPPLHPAAPAAALRDARLYELLALVDVFRVGTARDKNVALTLLRARI